MQGSEALMKGKRNASSLPLPRSRLRKVQSKAWALKELRFQSLGAQLSPVGGLWLSVLRQLCLRYPVFSF